MKTVTVDIQHRIRIGGEAPETKFWLVPQPNGYLLQRIEKPESGKRPSKAEALNAISKNSVHFTLPCAELMRMTVKLIDTNIIISAWEESEPLHLWAKNVIASAVAED